MKKQLMILALSSLTISGFAEAPSEATTPRKEKKGTEQSQRPNRNPEEMRKRHQAMTGKVLADLGVSKADQVKFQEMQKSFHEKMRKNKQQTMKAHEQLKQLQENGATEEELDAAIQHVADLKAAEMKILVKSRMQSESIIGKEKHGEFMKVAREKYRKHKGKKDSERSLRKGKEKEKQPITE